MKLYELLDNVLYEDRLAPLYHFTTLKNFYSILNSNELRGNARMDALDWSKVDMGAGGIAAQRKKTPKIISLTRDPNRTFIPGSTGEGIGFRIDKNKLAQNYKIDPSTHNTSLASGKLSDKDKETIERIKKDLEAGKTVGTLTSNGKNLTDIAKGLGHMHSRFESEERVYTDKITNFGKYVTGIVIPTRKKVIKKDDDVGVALHLLHYSGSLDPRKGRTGKLSYAMRDNLLNAAIKLNVPIVFARREHEPENIKKSIGKLMWLKKNKSDEFYEILEKYMTVDVYHGRKTVDPVRSPRLSTGKITHGDYEKMKFDNNDTTDQGNQRLTDQ